MLRLLKVALTLMLTLGLNDLSQAELVELIAKSKPSIVVVGTSSPTDSPRFGARTFGTGFVVGDGHWVVTNAHVLPETLASDTIKLQLAVLIPGAVGEQALRTAKVETVDKLKDLALLRIEGPALPPLTLAKSGYVPEGTPIAFIGFPIGGALGFSPVTHRGIVSSVTGIATPSSSSAQLNAQAVRRLREGAFNIYQLDATAYPGNSGGPLLDANTGEVIGILNATYVKGSKESALTAPSGISYAIPVKYIIDLIEQR